jgi:molecular chaperone GrpE
METVADGNNEHLQLIQGGAHPAGTELPDLLRRERADFLNYKRRVELERTLDREQACAALIAKVLPLLDELDRAFDHLPPELEPHAWVRGVALSRRRLEEILREWGVERIGLTGERFDPTLHEAVTYEPRPDLDEPVVAAVEQAGYRLGRRLVRAARVSVAGPTTPS